MCAARPPHDVRRIELATFLRRRREGIAPEEVGLVRGGRRRTPGLRREEVAHLASVGVTWYTWLEQGREIQASAQVMDALARALRLDGIERAHLFSLAGMQDPAPNLSRPPVTPTVRRMLDELAPIPACVQNSRYDMIAYNSTYSRLYCDLNERPAEDRNFMWLVFTDEDWQAADGDLPRALRGAAARFRSAMAEHLTEPGWQELHARLAEASPRFRELWEHHEVFGQEPRVKHIHNAHVGLLHMEILWLRLQAGTDAHMVLHIPLDNETRNRLARLEELGGADS
ncbi:helix-turn-helix transcriptional regulator [Streptomyces sp. NBC_01264]|uniref:helix-turn-helix transcriptional regulator n=1 Tax=Streptomyces sp. NBC_01264 TaxID=2903804 RepID=UPI00225105A2|nr:helix-turn-helix transcriptional regulator [Streptomyces sp. NBC_01264]MCX4782833.1 helix-turn-helix transcriptional regulator [Streptomyces sp. NBC_01264]